jgi:hypothetical protein
LRNVRAQVRSRIIRNDNTARNCFCMAFRRLLSITAVRWL